MRTIKKSNRPRRRSFPKIICDLIDAASKGRPSIVVGMFENELYQAIEAQNLKIRNLESLVAAMEKRLGKGDMLDPRRKD